MVLLPFALCSPSGWEWCLYQGDLGDWGELYSLSSFLGLPNRSSSSKGLAEKLLLAAGVHGGGLSQRGPSHTTCPAVWKASSSSKENTAVSAFCWDPTTHRSNVSCNSAIPHP